MILCDSCQTKSCNKIITCETLLCDRFTPPPLNVKVGDIVWVMMKHHLSGNTNVFLPWKLYISFIDDTFLFCGNGARCAKLNKAEYKIIFSLTEEECTEACDVCTRKARELNAM